MRGAYSSYRYALPTDTAISKNALTYIRLDKMKLILFCFVNVVCLLQIAAASSCSEMQQNHHQILNENFDDIANDIYTAAIDRTNDDGYAFTAQFCPTSTTNTNSDTCAKRILLVKLDSNAPFESPFLINWAKSYHELSTATTTATTSQLMVRDVKQTKTGNFILCGRFKSEDTDSGAFLLRTDSNGDSPVMKVYKDIHILKSVVKWESNDTNEGFFAVGIGTEKNGKSSAAMLSTDSNLNPICMNEVHGVTTSNKKNPINDFNQVVQYKKNEYVMVGSTQGGYDATCTDEAKNSDVLFAMASVVNCNIKRKKQIGSDTKNEWGRSVTVQGKLMTIAGTIRKMPGDDCSTPNNDLLLFTLSKKAQLKQWKSFNFDKKNDIGMSILWRKKTKTYLIAGETETKKLTNNGSISKDLFLLETDKKLKFKKFEIFGGEQSDSGEVDLVLSSDNNAVIVGNSNSFGINGRQDTYLIERYDSVASTCHDMEMKVKTKTPTLEIMTPIDKKKNTIARKKIKLETTDITLSQDIQCPKACPTLLPTTHPTATPTLSPTDSPTATPALSPTDSPTQIPTTSMPTRFFEGPFITAENSSEIVNIPNPPTPEFNPRTNCPHLQSGLLDWHDPSTWPGPSPSAGNDVTLPSNSKILVNQAVSEVLGLITIPASSELIFGENISGITLDAGGFDVKGALIAGSDTCRLETPLTITLHGERPSDIVTNAKPPSFKGISVTGFIQMHAKRYYRTWTRLAKDALPGEDFLLLQHPVNWEEGQDLVLVTTAVKDSRDWHQNEQLTVDSVEPGPEGVPAVVYLKSPVQELHVANLGYQAEVGLLSRLITIQGAADDSEPSDPDPGTCTGRNIFGNNGRPCEDKELTGFGGHIMVHGDGKAYVEGVELYRMGQTNVIGRYPMHFHVLGTECEGCYFRDCSVHRSYYRCVSIHGTNNVIVSENVAYDVTGYCYYLEDGVEEGNTISFNLAALIHMLGTPAFGNGQKIDLAYQSDDLTLPADVTAAGYYITNMHNNIIGNAASGGWAGFAFPVFFSPVGIHQNANIRPANRLSLEIDGNTAHSTGWWWGHAGAFYFGGSLYYEGNTLVYNAGRDQSHNRQPCLVDKCEAGDCGSYCYKGERAWNRITNSKAFLVPSVGLNSWNGRMEVVGFEAHDVALGLEALEAGFFIDDMLVVCRTGVIWKMPLYGKANYIKGNGFFWYDTGQEHIITNATFRNCGQRNGYDEYDQSPTRGCDNNPNNGCSSGSTVFGFLTHSDQFTPELMQGTKNISFEACGRRFKLHDFNTNNVVSTVSGRNQNWVDVDGSVSGLDEPTLIGSGLLDAGLWWQVDADVVHDPQGPLKFIKKNNGPTRGLAHIRIEWDNAVHQTVGGSSCGNGNSASCPALGYIRHFGPLYNQDPGLPITAQPEIVGPAGGFGWLLALNDGAPKKLIIKAVEVDPSTPLLLAILYPLGTTFTITAKAGWCSPSSSYSCDEIFKQTSSPTEVRHSVGNTYFFDGTTGLLYVKIVMAPKYFTGDTMYTQHPTWHFWNYNTPGRINGSWAIDRFSRNGVLLPRSANGPYLQIDASCATSGAFCSEIPTTVEPEVCPSGYEQVAYDKCCMTSSPNECIFSPSPAPTTSPQPSTSQPTRSPASNILTNPGFETGDTTGWFAFYSTTIMADSLNPHNGVYSVLVSGRTAGWQGIAQNLLSSLSAGETYEMSCWAKLKNSTSDTFKLTLRVTDNNGPRYIVASQTITNVEWFQISRSFTLDVTGSLTEAILYAEGPVPGVEFYLDDVRFVQL